MVTSLIASLLVFAPVGPTDFSCAVMGSPSTMKGPSVDFAGARYPMCCGGCPGPFAADPAKYIQKAGADKKTIGYSLFDPTTGLKIDLKKLPDTFSDFGGNRYFFTTAEGKAAFDAKPKSFAVSPQKEVLYCTVMGHEIASYGDAGAYTDHAGVRYYFCCGDCQAAFKGDASKYAGVGKAMVKAPKAVKVAG